MSRAITRADPTSSREQKRQRLGLEIGSHLETNMTQRLSLAKSNAGLDAMRAVESWLDENLDSKLLALVKVRASQINGCAFCLHMQRAGVETGRKLGSAAFA